jgi:hypothetical protein
MFTLTEQMHYYLYPGYVDMNYGIEKLSELVRTRMGISPLYGDVFLFFGKKRDTIKILRWDNNGFFLMQKRLEFGRFELPHFQPDTRAQPLSWEAFFFIMRGIPLKKLKPRKGSRRALNGI